MNTSKIIIYFIIFVSFMLSSVFLLFGMKLKNKYENFVKKEKETEKEEVLIKKDVEKFKSTGNIFLIVSFILAFFAISFGFFIDNSLTPLRVAFLYMCVVFLGCLISMRNAGKLKD